MTDLIIDTINNKTKEEKQEIEFGDINKHTTVNDYEELGGDSNSDFEDEDKSYETSDDSTIDGNNNLPDDPIQPDKDQQQHFNVLEVNDINEDDSSSENKRVGDKGVDNEDDPIQDNEEIVHKIEDEDGAIEEDDKPVQVDDPSIGIVNNEGESRVNNEQPIEPEESAHQDHLLAK